MAEEENRKGEQVVTPWEAKAGEGQSSINYDKLIGGFKSVILKCWELKSGALVKVRGIAMWIL